MTLQKCSIDKQSSMEQIKSKTKVNVGKDIITMTLKRRIRAYNNKTYPMKTRKYSCVLAYVKAYNDSSGHRDCKSYLLLQNRSCTLWDGRAKRIIITKIKNKHFFVLSFKDGIDSITKKFQYICSTFKGLMINS